MTRLPLVSDSATSRPAGAMLIRKNEVSPSFQASPSRTREVTASRKLATACPLGVNRSSGSSVRLPATATKVSMAPSLGSVCLRARRHGQAGWRARGRGRRGRNQPSSAACRRFLAGQNVGGAQAASSVDVAGEAVRRTPPWVSLAGQRDHATLWLANEHTETGGMAGLRQMDLGGGRGQRRYLAATRRPLATRVTTVEETEPLSRATGGWPAGGGRGDRQRGGGRGLQRPRW